MARIVPFSKNREAIYDLLTRTKKFHCPVSGVYEFDVTQLSERLEAAQKAGRSVTFTACMVRATALVLVRYPRFNHHLFHGLFRKKEVAFDDINCNLVVVRQMDNGERILLPLILHRANEMSLDEISTTITHHKTAPLSELPQMQAIERIKKLPRFLISLFSYRVRSNPDFYLKYFGTYGLSSMAQRGWGPRAGHAVANTGSAFFPGELSERPVVIDGEVAVRTIMSLMITVDHYLLDGMDVAEAVNYLRQLLVNPEKLGLS